MNKKYILAIFTAAVLWFIMFSPWTSSFIDFWIVMPFAAVILCIVSVLLNKNLKTELKFSIRDVITGIMYAVILWIIFVCGDYISNFLFSFEKAQVSSIYGMKAGHDSYILTILLLFLIGPAEEIFWRGTIQKYFMKKNGPWSGVLITSIIYALVHLWSFNFMLIMAAFVCGIFWGTLFLYKKRLSVVIISHAVWDVAVFILLPIV